MKKLGILFVLMFAAILTPAKGYSGSQASFKSVIKNCSEKMHIKLSNLYFSNEGIFLKTHSDEWNSIDYISHDADGYYLTVQPLSNNSESYKNVMATVNCFNGYDSDAEANLRVYTNQDNGQEFYFYGADIIECGSRASGPEVWQCPYCHYWSPMGEKCKNKKCATNQWKASN